MKYVLLKILITLLILSCIATKDSINQDKKGLGVYYQLNVAENSYYKLQLFDNVYDLIDGSCEYISGSWEILKTNPNKVILFKDTFKAMVHDTLNYDKNSNQYYSKKYLFKKEQENLELNLRYKLISNKYVFKKIKLDTMFNCREVLIKNKMIRKKDNGLE